MIPSEGISRHSLVSHPVSLFFQLQVPELVQVTEHIAIVPHMVRLIDVMDA